MEIKNKKEQYFDIEIKTNIKYDKCKNSCIGILDKYDDELKQCIIRLFSLKIGSEVNYLFEKDRIYINRKKYNTYFDPVSLSDKIMLTFRFFTVDELTEVLTDALTIQGNIPFIVSISIW